MKARKAITLFSIFLALLRLFFTLLQLSLQLLLLHTRLALWEKVQAWKFRRSCSKYVKGSSLEELSSLYSLQLRQARKQLSITYWLNQAWETRSRKIP